MAKSVAAQSTLVDERDSSAAASPSLDQKQAIAKRCSHGVPLIFFFNYVVSNCCELLIVLCCNGLTEAVLAGAKAAAVATVATAIPTVS